MRKKPRPFGEQVGDLIHYLAIIPGFVALGLALQKHWIAFGFCVAITVAQERFGYYLARKKVTPWRLRLGGRRRY